MSLKKTTLEVIAPSVEEAVQKGLDQLNLPEDAVDVEVLDAGSRGLFGLGSRQARIRLTIKNQAEPQSVPFTQVKTAEMAPKVTVEFASDAAPSAAEPVVEQEAVNQPESESMIPEADDEEISLGVARDVVTDLLDKMKVKATISASFREPEDDEDTPVMLIDVEGDDLSILIGRRSETLNALQYISSLIICKRLDRWVPIMIDVQGYRARRERQLRQLARRMADQAVHTGRRQVLEPMPANERRLIHMELRDSAEVSTESVGDEPNRKVTIFLKKQE